MVRSSVIPQECHERWICVDQGFSIYSSRVHRIWLMPPHGLGQYSTNTYKAWFTVPTIPEARRTAQEGSGQAQGRWSVSNASSSTLPCRHPEVGCSIYVMFTQPEGHLETFHSFLKHPLCGHKIIIESKVRSYVFSVIGIQAPKKKEGLPFPSIPCPLSQCEYHEAAGGCLKWEGSVIFGSFCVHLSELGENHPQLAI